MIELKQVSKKYENGAIGLDGISLFIEKGEFVFLTGTSGSGKSTLLRLLMKEISPTEGQIIINGKDVTHLKRRQVTRLRRDLGVVFQDFRLLSDRTVYENIAFAMKVLGKSNQEIRRKVPLVLKLVDLLKKAKCYPHELSGGEQQRVAIARAIINESPILIADEPTGNLDPTTSLEIMRCLEKINQRGVTVLMATHDKEIVNTFQKRVVEIGDGRIVKNLFKGGYDETVEYIKLLN